jgi:cytochrome c oxidase cbb3-type subunit 3
MKATNQKTSTAMNRLTFYKSILSIVMLVLSYPVMAQTNGGANSENQLLYGLLISLAVLFLVIIMILNNAIKGLAENKSLWKSRFGKGGTTILALLFSISALDSVAVSPDATVIGVLSKFSSTFWLLVCVDIFLALIIIVQLRIFKGLIDGLKEPVAEEDVDAVLTEEAPGFMDKVMQMLNRSVPVEQEADVLTDHDYDGIRELDNVLPPWWVAMFYGCIVFAFVYLVHYHVLGTGKLQIAEFEQNVMEAEEQVAAFMALQTGLVDETSVTLLTDQSRLKSGADIYSANCVACHGALGEGGVGPNFSDQYWIHGGSINDVFKTIKYGVPSKGMISWKTQLSASQMQDVASYIFSFQGTNPPNGKAPEGDLYTPAVADSISTEVIVLTDSLTIDSTAVAGM